MQAGADFQGPPIISGEGSRSVDRESLVDGTGRQQPPEQARHVDQGQGTLFLGVQPNPGSDWQHSSLWAQAEDAHPILTSNRPSVPSLAFRSFHDATGGEG